MEIGACSKKHLTGMACTDEIAKWNRVQKGMLNQDLFNTFTLKKQTCERIYLTMGMILMHQGLVIHHHSYQTRILNLEFEITIYYLCLTIKAPSLTIVFVVPCIPRILFKKCTVNTLHCLHVVSA